MIHEFKKIENSMKRTLPYLIEDFDFEQCDLEFHPENDDFGVPD